MEIIKSTNRDYMNELLSLKLKEKTFHVIGDKYFVYVIDQIIFGIAKVSELGKIKLVWVSNPDEEIDFTREINDLLDCHNSNYKNN